MATLPLSVLTRDEVLVRLAEGEAFIYLGRTFIVPADVPDDATLAAWAGEVSGTSPTAAGTGISPTLTGASNPPFSTVVATSNSAQIVPARPTRRYVTFVNTDAQTTVWVVPPGPVVAGVMPTNSIVVAAGLTSPAIAYTGELWATVDPTTGTSAAVSVIDIYD